MGDSVPPRHAAILAILALTLAPLGAHSQSVPPQYSSRLTQVEVYATISDARGAPVRGLQRDDFAVSEDGVPQPITTFAADGGPAAVALAIDRSFSMRGTPLTVARTAGRVFVSSLQPDDRAMLISISGEVDVLAPFSAGREGVLSALATLDAWGTTSLHDAIVRCFALLDHERGRRAVVLLSDGDDRYSTAQPGDVLARAQRSDVLVYGISIGKAPSPLFAELAAVTGGRSFHLRDVKTLQATLQSVAADLKAQYLIGYEQPPLRLGGEDWRSIRVETSRSGVSVRARSGYVAR